MPKSQFIDPSVMRAPGFVHFEDIPVNRYNKTIAEEKANYSTEDFLRIYHDMAVIREFETMINLIKTTSEYNGIHYSHPGPAHLGIGQEAAAVGQAYLLDKNDFIFGSHRSHADILAKGLSCIEKLSDEELMNIMKSTWDGATLRVVENNGKFESVKEMARAFFLYGVVAELFARETGFSKGLGGSMHAFFLPFGIYPNNAIVGGSAGIAAGAALYKRVNCKEGLVIANIGDASLGCGPVWEAMNFSAMDQYTQLWDEAHKGGLPIIFNIFNNQYGMGGQTNGEGGEISTPLTLYYENDLGGEIIYDTAMNEILTDEAGVVTGVTCTRKGGAKLTLYARKGVILATGGYARNKEMVARYPVAHYFSNVPHGNVGDGLTAAEKIGALNYEHPAVQVVYTSLTCGIGINDESGLIVNDRGERVVNEWSYQYTVSDAIARSGSNCGWYITSGKEPYGGVQYGYKSAVAGKSKDPCATSIEGLAKKMGCDPATLQATYDRYCELVERGVDEDFGKPAEFLHPIKGPKFVALRLHPCVTVTFGGLETDISARVMKPDGSVIPHLYAAGEVAGTGMYGTQYPTCGTSIGSALFYGRIAGRAVTDQALL